MQNDRENSSFGSHPDDAAVFHELPSKCLESQAFDASAVQNKQPLLGAINPAFSRSSPGVLDPLTPAQQRVLDFVQSFHLANGFPPTREEIAQHFSWGSANAAQCHLYALQAKGAIRLIRGQSRGIRVLNETETLSLPQRTPIQRQAIQVRNIWDQEGCHSAQFPEALSRLLNMVLE